MREWRAAVAVAIAVAVAMGVAAAAAAAGAGEGGGDECGRRMDEADGVLEAGEAAAAAAMYASIKAECGAGMWEWRREANTALALASATVYDQALAAAETAAALNATLDLAFLRGFLYVMAERHGDAIALLAPATAADPSRGNGWLYLGDAYAAEANWALAKKAYQSAWRLLRSVKALRALGFAYRALGKETLEARLYASAVAEGVLVDARQRPDILTPDIAAAPWHDAADFAFTPALEAGLGVVVDELAAALAADPDRTGPVFHLVGTGGKFAHDRGLYAASGKAWHQIVLAEHGELGAGAAAFPRTVARLAAIVPDALEYGRAVISIIEPGVAIVPHCGPTNERLTVHCGLVVPSGIPNPPSIVVGGESRQWAPGSCFVFDDSFEHEVTYAAAPGNDGGLRAVLLFHIPHPDTVAERNAAAAAAASAAENEWMRLQFGDL